MKQDAYNPFIIFSGQTAISEALHFSAERRNKIQAELTQLSIKYTLVKGSYKGVEEDAFLVSSSHEALVQALCERFNQESYLKVSTYRVAELVYLRADGNKVHDVIGSFQSVSEEEALSHDAWTRHNGQYYIVK